MDHPPGQTPEQVQPREPTGARIVAFPHAGAFPAHDAAPGPDTHVRPYTNHIPTSIGVSSGAYYPHIPTEETPLAAARAGVSVMEIMLQTAGEYAPGFVRELRANTRQAGVRVHSVHTMLHLHPLLGPYPRRTAEAREMFKRGIEAAAALDARILVWHGARRAEVTTADGWERLVETTHDLAALCGEAGITLAVENVAAGALSLVRHVVRFATRLAEIGTPDQIGFTFDPFQAAEAGANPFMILAAMGNRVVNVHLSDYAEHHAQRGRRHLVPGDGDLPWSALIRAIGGSGYVGPLLIEGPAGNDPDAITRARAMLEPLLRSVVPIAPVAPNEDTVMAMEYTADTPPPGVLKGIALFNERKFYEQHEVVEHEWHAERRPIRQLYQGLLQIGVGFYHALNGNQAGAVSLLRQGIARTAAFTPRALGIETGHLVSASQVCLERIEALGPERIREFAAEDIPSIRMTT